jgi:signal transduction histidine kinase
MYVGPADCKRGASLQTLKTKELKRDGPISDPLSGRSVQNLDETGYDAVPADCDRPMSPPPVTLYEDLPRHVRWHVVYYLLAAFDVLTVTASLVLSFRLLEIYQRSVTDNQEWAGHLDEYAELQRLAAAVNSPGNDVFESHDAGAERERLDAARAAFARSLELLRRHVVEAHRSDAPPLLRRFDTVEAAMAEMSAEAGITLDEFARGGPEPAGRRMATMDRRFSGVLGALQELRGDVRAVQLRLFQAQTAAAVRLQRYEVVIAVLIAVMVAAAILYGRRLEREMGREADARERYRRDLEARMEERTRALRESEAALAQAASDWRRTFDAIDSPVMILDLGGRLVRANATVRALSGISPGSGITGSNVTAMSEREPWETASRVASVAVASRATRSAEAHDAATGRSWDVSAYYVEPEGTNEARVIVVAKDTTRVLELRETLRREETMAQVGSLVLGVAHEVRNPIFAISLTLDSFEARYGDTPGLEKYFPVLRREVDRLGHLMRDLLDYGRPPRVEAVPVALRNVVAEAIRASENDARTREVEVVNDVSAALPDVVVDPQRMAQVFQNVVHNAILHTPPNGRVAVNASMRKLAEGQRWVEATVRDTGPGFKPEDLVRIFRPFVTGRAGGTGLGLAIAQRIVEMHGGTISAGNAPEGGALVTIRFPVEAVVRLPANA